MSSPAATRSVKGRANSPSVEDREVRDVSPPDPRLKTDPEPTAKTDLRMLNEGTFSDFTVFCGNKQWKTHKVILVRCPYFDRALSEKSGFMETKDSSITIDGFEEYEISWLLQYIYGTSIDVETAKLDTPNKSSMETCVLLWSVGDFFCLQYLADHALTLLNRRTADLFFQAGQVSKQINGIEFLPDLEAGILAAWRDDRTPGPARQSLIHLCIGLTPYLRDNQSFTALLEDVPDFSTQFLKALLGCPEDNKFPHYPGAGGICPVCNTVVSVPRSAAQVPANMYYRPTTSLAFHGGKGGFFCSEECYKSTLRNGLEFPM